VQEVLDRAGVGRTTFYTHYRDKQDLFLSDIEQFLEMASSLLQRRAAPASRIAPVEELFAHIADARDLYKAFVASGKWTDVRELGTVYFARSIEQRLPASGSKLSGLELRAASHALAGALFSMLDWWVLHGQDISPARMDALFHQQALNHIEHIPKESTR
jgi:AcrR family transcriptional regulator